MGLVDDDKPNGKIIKPTNTPPNTTTYDQSNSTISNSNNENNKINNNNNNNNNTNPITPTPPNDSKINKLIHSLFGKSIGLINERRIYSCWNYHNRGKLYLGTRHVGFYANFFGFEKRINIPLTDIAELTPVGCDAIRITTMDGDETEFRSFDDREEVIGTLKGLRRQSLMTLGMMNRSGDDEEDVNNSNGRGKDDGVEVSFHGTTTPTKPQQQQQQRHDRKSHALPGDLHLLSESSTKTKQNSINVINAGDEDETPEEERASLALAAMADFSSLSLLIRQKKQLETEGYNVDDNQKIMATTTSPRAKVAMEGDDDGGGGGRPKDLKMAWMEAKEVSFSDCGFESIQLPCSLDTFQSTFLSDNAPHSIATYQRNVIGDSEITTSPWSSSISSSSSETRTRHTRHIRYRHPINAPMAPPSAIATKEQTMERYGSYGIVVVTCTTVQDVPMTDCFVVDDLLMVEQQPAAAAAEGGGGGGGVVVTARFEVRFVKSTMWRRIINSTTVAEFKKYFKGYATMLRDECAASESERKDGMTAAAAGGVPSSTLLPVTTTVDERKVMRGDDYYYNRRHVMVMMGVVAVLLVMILIFQFLMLKQMMLLNETLTAALLQDDGGMGTTTMTRNASDNSRDDRNVVAMMDDVVNQWDEMISTMRGLVETMSRDGGGGDGGDDDGVSSLPLSSSCTDL